MSKSTLLVPPHFKLSISHFWFVCTFTIYLYMWIKVTWKYRICPLCLIKWTRKVQVDVEMLKSKIKKKKIAPDHNLLSPLPLENAFVNVNKTNTCVAHLCWIYSHPPLSLISWHLQNNSPINSTLKYDTKQSRNVANKSTWSSKGALPEFYKKNLGPFDKKLNFDSRYKPKSQKVRRCC